MTPEAQRIAIAEACGWWVEQRDDGIGKWSVLISPDKKRVDSTSGVATLGNFGCLPDYPNDLNAMHEAEKVLENDETKWKEYRDWLYVLLESNRHEINATAAQRANALLKTIGKWREDV